MLIHWLLFLIISTQNSLLRTWELYEMQLYHGHHSLFHRFVATNWLALSSSEEFRLWTFSSWLIEQTDTETDAQNKKPQREALITHQMATNRAAQSQRLVLRFGYRMLIPPDPIPGPNPNPSPSPVDVPVCPSSCNTVLHKQGATLDNDTKRQLWRQQHRCTCCAHGRGLRMGMGMGIGTGIGILTGIRIGNWAQLQARSKQECLNNDNHRDHDERLSS